MNIILQLEQEQIAKLGREIPDFQPGDTLVVNVKVKEGERSRIQAYEGVCIARSAPASRRASRSARSPTARASSGCFRSTRR
jgi:ribosomal protein L19